MKKILINVPTILFPDGEFTAVEWMLKDLGRKYEDEFIVSEKESGYLFLVRRWTK